MDASAGVREQLVKALAENFYAVVPASLQTYCSVTSRICREVLQHFGVAAELRPCQLWYAAPGKNYVVGFLGRTPERYKWDGHVICVAGAWFIDAALHHLHAQFGLSVPRIVSGPCFQVPTQAIARIDLNGHDSLWWYQAPRGMDATPPEEPPELIAHHAGAVIERLSAACA